MRGTLVATYHPSLKLILLLALVIASFILVFLFGIVLAMPFFGTDVLDKLVVDVTDLDDTSLAILKYFQIVNQIGVFIVPAVAFALLIEGKFFNYMRLNRSVSSRFYIAGTVLIFAVLPFISWLIDINSLLSFPESFNWLEQWMQEREEEARLLTEALLETTSLSGLLLNLFMVALLAAVGEELIFRGILVRVITEWAKNHHIAVWISAILFSALHLQFYGFVPRMVLGVLLGYLFIWSGSLRLPILVHFINNAAAVIIGFLYTKEIINTDIESFGSTNNTWIIIGSVLLMAIIMLYIRWQGRRRIA
jgi:hypothetical protein